MAARQHGVVSRRQLLDADMNPRRLRRMVATGEWQALAPGVYASSASPSTWDRQLWAAYLSRPGALVTGRSAALLLGFPGVRASRPELLVSFSGNARSSLATIHRSRLFPLVGSVRVANRELTNPAETLLVLGYSNLPSQIERWVDALLATNQLEVDDFDPIFARLTNAGVPGLNALRRIVGARDRDSYQPPTSELERLLYRMLDSESLPTAVRQVPLSLGAVAATVDAYIAEWKLIVEADGRRWHTRKADFERDRERDNAAAAHGIIVVRFTYRMLKKDPDSCRLTLIEAGRHR